MIGRFGPFEYSLNGRYQFEQELGRGAMGVVYRALDLKLDRAVAIKVLHPALTNEVGASRFQSEIQITAALDHPRIVKIFEAGEADGHLYYVMPYVRGETLRAILAREKQLPVDEALTITRQVAEALQAAHERHIVHRDVKPDNILVTEAGAQVLDFGLAHSFRNADAQRLTASGLAVGTPHYLSPEQASAERHIGPRADQYALACVLYEMLVGEPPFTGPTVSAVAMRHLSDAPPALRQRRKSAPVALEMAVLRAMEKVPADRFATITMFADAASATSTTVTPRPDLAPVRARTTDLAQRRLSRRAATLWTKHPRRVAAIGLAVALAAATAAIVPIWRPTARDPSSIIIFPLYTGGVASDPGQTDVGESAALLIDYRLDGTPGIQFSNAADHLVGSERTGQTELTITRKRDIAREVGADRIIDGWVRRHDDSVTVVLRLQASNGAGPTIQKGFTASASIADAPRLALVALRELLPAFLDPERRYDPTALEQRDPAAIAAFLEGERYYRASRFEEAVARYQTAVQRDSLLAVAALKAAQAQSWLNRTADAVEYADLALRHIRLLPPRYAVFASGLRHYLRGDGDSTIALTRPLVDANPDWTDAWFLLGEAYLHLMPSTPVAQQEAMADSAYRMVEQSDSAFAPAREHMLDIALRRRKIARAESLAVMSRRTLSADDARWLDAILRCVRDGPSSVDWNGLRNRSPRAAWRWGETLVFEPANAACARAAFAVTLALPAAAPRELWGAVVGTNALLVAAGRDADAGRLLQGNAAESVRGWALLFPDAAAGADVERAAARKADSLGTNFDRLATPYLWVLTSWYSGRGDSVVLGRIAASMAVRRDSTHRHLDSLVAAVAAAHVAAARHDTSSALRLLEPLRPVAPYTDLMWQPWEAFAGERMLQASLLAGKGRLDEAIRVASKMDVQVPMINLIYLRRSLELRERWSLQLRDTVAAARYRMELDHWSAAIR